MSNVNAPRGFKPLKYVDNRPFNGGITSYILPTAYATAVYAGDVVKFLGTGYLAKAAAGDQMRGVVAGFRWTNAFGVPVVANYLPVSTATLNGTDIVVEVYDDPGLVFEAVFTNSSIVIPNSDKGMTFNLFDAGGIPNSGLSGEGIDVTTGSVGALQFRFLDFVARVDNDPLSANPRGLFVPALHDFRVNTGI